MQWETIVDDSLNSRYSGPRGGMHVVSDLSQLETRFNTFENKIKGLLL